MDGLREVNLEAGMPIVDAAIKRLTMELKTSHRQGLAVVKVIHGYGSTGKGGRIRTETRRYLEVLQKKGDIAGFITGEKFSIFEEATRQAFLRCPDLRQDRDLERHNNGVTFILL